MTNPTNLKHFKEKKRIKKIVSDLEKIEHLLSLILQGLGTYKRYTPIRELLTEILDKKGMIKLYLKKYKAILIEKYENKLEEISK